MFTMYIHTHIHAQVNGINELSFWRSTNTHTESEIAAKLRAAIVATVQRRRKKIVHELFRFHLCKHCIYLYTVYTEFEIELRFCGRVCLNAAFPYISMQCKIALTKYRFAILGQAVKSSYFVACNVSQWFVSGFV